jgi:hypothetical protein
MVERSPLPGMSLRLLEDMADKDPIPPMNEVLICGVDLLIPKGIGIQKIRHDIVLVCSEC